MRYLGGKMRQSKQIVENVRVGYLGGKMRQSYVEPFCGAMWSATAMIRAFPDWNFHFNDVNPYLMRFWTAAVKEGFDPPEYVSEEDYRWYNDRRPIDDPMTGYIGFSWSFGGKFFGGAARTDEKIKGSYKSTRDKVFLLRSSRVTLTCGDFSRVVPPRNSIVYLDPPYLNRTAQRKENVFCRESYLSYARRLARSNFVLATEFHNDHGWELLHDYGDTVVRHLNAKPKDGTRELLMRVTS